MVDSRPPEVGNRDWVKAGSIVGLLAMSFFVLGLILTHSSSGDRQSGSAMRQAREAAEVSKRNADQLTRLQRALDEANRRLTALGAETVTVPPPAEPTTTTTTRRTATSRPTGIPEGDTPPPSPSTTTTTTTDAPATTTTTTAAPCTTVPVVGGCLPAGRASRSGPRSTSLGWAALRECESGGDYHNRSNPRFRGAYQFSYATWRSVGGEGDPADAPPEEQDARAQALYERSGRGQWPYCGRFLP